VKTDILCSQKQKQFPESVVSRYDGETIDLIKTEVLVQLFMSYSWLFPRKTCKRVYNFF